MLSRLYPFLAPINRRLFGDAVPETEVLQPAEPQDITPPAMLPGQLDRVTGTDEHSTLDFHLNAATETTIVHAPVLRHTYKNAIAHHSGFATRGYSERYGGYRELSDLAGKGAYVAQLRYCHDYVSWRYFGHWLQDSMPSAHIDPDLGALWMPHRLSWEHANHYLRALDLQTLDAPFITTDELVVYQDFGQGSHKSARYAQIKKKLNPQYDVDDAQGCVFLKRGMTGAARPIANEDELAEQLVARNWRILDVETNTVQELRETLSQARVAVSIEGSQINHAHVSLKRGGVLVILMPQDRFTTTQLGRCRAHGITPAVVVLEGNKHDGYYADVDEILRTIDLADAQAQ